MSLRPASAPYAAATAAAATLALLWLSLFTVGENQVALRSRFGQIQGGNYAPGLHWCWPFERIVRVERRILDQHLQGETFLSAEQQALVLDLDLNWRVHDAAAFLRESAGDEQVAADRLADAVRAELKASYAQQPLAQIVAAPRGGLSAALLGHLDKVAADLGVQLLDARVRRIDPTDEVANAIYASMQAAYAAQAKQVRAEGGADAGRIRAEAERNRAEILGAANRDAQRIRGEADAQAADIYAHSYGRNPEFAAFYRSMQAYRTALGREGDILVIAPEGEFYKYLHNPARH